MIKKIDAYIQIVVLILGIITTPFLANSSKIEVVFLGYFLVGTFQFASFVFHEFVDDKIESKFIKYYKKYLAISLILLIPPITIIGLTLLIITSPIIAILYVIFNYHENVKPIFKEDSIRWY